MSNSKCASLSHSDSTQTIYFFRALMASLISAMSLILALLSSATRLKWFFFSSVKLWSSSWCQGYNTKTWKASADEATKKFVIEKRFAIGMIAVLAARSRMGGM
ncbi:hypothetical protein VTL71DRAFT_13103 [Oculimacula yallundae]|uniref:Uncharacterized protein n=1 Tax=Oculimacula yallundae TaxID=86028 RepID=A0ABR4CPD1_9HELO